MIQIHLSPSKVITVSSAVYEVFKRLSNNKSSSDAAYRLRIRLELVQLRKINSF